MKNRVERAAISLMRAGRAALKAQERYYYWVQFKTNSPTFRRASERFNKSLEALDRAEVEMEEALQPYNR
jgi:hypothetical protein